MGPLGRHGRAQLPLRIMQHAPQRPLTLCRPLPRPLQSWSAAGPTWRCVGRLWARCVRVDRPWAPGLLPAGPHRAPCARLQEGITKLKRILEGEREAFTAEHYMMLCERGGTGARMAPLCCGPCVLRRIPSCCGAQPCSVSWLESPRPAQQQRSPTA